MSRKQFANFASLLFIFGLIVFPKATFAASLYFTSNSQNIYQGDVFVVEVRISSTERPINVADGTFLFDQSLVELKETSTGGSIFTVWAEQPIFSNDKGQVSFVGGVPEGFQEENGLIMRTIFAAKEEGVFELTFGEDFLVFLSDGKGTNLNPEQKPLSIAILKRPIDIAPKNEWQSFVAGDEKPPALFEAVTSRDPTIFDNQYFVSFLTTDAESGIAYYEVKEGDRDFVRAQSPYLLQDQPPKNVIQIKAVDRAGNERVVIALAPPPSLEISYGIYLILIFVVVLGLVLLFVLRRVVPK